MRTIGALTLAIGFIIMGGSALASDQVCSELSEKFEEPGKKTKVTVTAPNGFLIDQYCAKAGSANQGLGPEYVNVDPAQKSVTISHSSGKDLSHYSVSYVEDPNAEPDPEPTDEPTDDPTPPPDEECEEEDEGEEEGDGEGEEGEEDEEECDQPAPEQSTPPTTSPTTPPAQTTTTPATTQPVTQPVVVTPVVTEPAPKPLPQTEEKDEVKGVVISRSAQVLPATLAYTGPRDQIPLMWALATLFLATGLTLRIAGGRRAKQSTT
jgi:hypothetical protein